MVIKDECKIYFQRIFSTKCDRTDKKPPLKIFLHGRLSTF